MAIRVGINGMGRIGRTILREVFNRGLENEFEIVAVNNPGVASQYVHLLKYDSVHGRFNGDIHLEGENLSVKGKNIAFTSVRDPAEIPWNDFGVQVVIDATGKFKDKESLSKHLRGSVKKVVMCAPGKGLDGTFVVGINHETYDNATHNVISNASCTTNCLAPVTKVLHEAFGIENGFMTTVHAYTSDQLLLDGSHSDPRRARAAAMSIIPTTTGAAKAIGEVIPALKGKLDGVSFRVPSPNVSMIDLAANLKVEVTKEQINQALKEASNGALKGILDYTEEELVSTDFNGMRASSCVDASMTNVIGKTIKVVAWYDNETGFSNRVIDLVTFIGGKL